MIRIFTVTWHYLNAFWRDIFPPTKYLVNETERLKRESLSFTNVEGGGYE